MPLRIKTDLNSNPVYVLTLEQFELVLLKLDRQGNQKAQQIRDCLVGLSLTQLFSDAFGIRFEQEERQEYLKRRLLTKETFWFLTDGVKEYYRNNPRIERYPGQNYSEVFDELNVELFGKTSKEIKSELQIGGAAIALGIIKGLPHKHFRC